MDKKPVGNSYFFNKGGLEAGLTGLFLFIIIAGVLFIGNYRFVQAAPGGTDFLYRWLPTRLVLLNEYDNPYSPEVEYQVELVHHGHAHEGDETPGIFAYPYYTMGVFLPFAFIGDFSIARSVWMTFMELAHLGIAFLSLRIINFTPTKFLGFALVLFSLLTADFAQALVDGNPSSLAAFFVILALFFISNERDVLAGIFLAFSTIKPQLVILFFPFVWIWAFSVKRLKIIYASGATLFVLLSVSFLMQPNWILEFYKDLTTYVDVAKPSTPRAILSFWMPVPIANIISIILSIVSIYIVFQVVRSSFGKDFSEFFWASSLIFVLMPLTGITSAKSNYIAMLPAIVLFLWVWSVHIKLKEIWLAFFLILWMFLSWLFFFAGRNWTVEGTLIYFVDFYPLPLFLLVLTFWSKPLQKTYEFRH